MATRALRANGAGFSPYGSVVGFLTALIGITVALVFTFNTQLSTPAAYPLNVVGAVIGVTLLVGGLIILWRF